MIILAGCKYFVRKEEFSTLSRNKPPEAFFGFFNTWRSTSSSSDESDNNSFLVTKRPEEEMVRAVVDAPVPLLRAAVHCVCSLLILCRFLEPCVDKEKVRFFPLSSLHPARTASASCVFLHLIQPLAYFYISFSVTRYSKMSQVPPILDPKEDDIQKMLASDVHLGTANLDTQMEKYVWKRRPDGVHIINLGKTWEKLQLAARIIVAIENPQDICVISARTWGQRAVLKFAGMCLSKALREKV